MGFQSPILKKKKNIKMKTVARAENLQWHQLVFIDNTFLHFTLYPTQFSFQAGSILFAFKTPSLKHILIPN